MQHQRPQSQQEERSSSEAAVQALVRDAFKICPPTASPSFRTGVWKRIDAQNNPSSWAQWLRGHIAGVTATTAVCALLAASGGGLLAYQQNRTLRQQQIMLYVSSIDAHQRLEAEASTQQHSLHQ